MKFDDTHTFDKPSDDVIAMFTDRAYFERKYAELGFTGIEVLEHEHDGDNFRVKIKYTAKSDASVPGFAKKFLGETNTVIQQDAWNAATKTGRLDAEIQGLPAKVSANMELQDAGDGCKNTLSWTIDCSVPLVGGKIENLVAEDIRAKSGADNAKSNEILADY